MSLKNTLIILISLLFITYEYGVRLTGNRTILDVSSYFGLSDTQMSVLSFAYYVSYFIFLLPSVILINKFGLYRAWLGAICALTLGCVLFASSSSLLLLVTARVLMGIGSSFTLIGVFVIISGLSSKGKIIGLLMSLVVFGSMWVIGPWILLIDNFRDWKDIYWFAAICGDALLLLWVVVGRATREHCSTTFPWNKTCP